MVRGDVVHAEDLSFLEGGYGPVLPQPGNGAVGPLFAARDAWERAYILHALDAMDGNISRTADVLGLERSNLYKKMRGLGIGPRERDD
jgi:two-component system nitrogen regulation response regulator NtrX